MDRPTLNTHRALAMALCATLANANGLAAQARDRAAALGSSQRIAIDSFVRRTMQSRRIPGVAVAVVHDGAVVYRNAFGVANLETETPLSVTAELSSCHGLHGVLRRIVSCRHSIRR